MKKSTRAFLLALPLVGVVGIICYAANTAQLLADKYFVSSNPLTAAAGKIPVGDGTGYAEVSMSGDATIASGGAISVTKTGGAPFVASATTDTTNAANISSGLLNLGRLTPGTSAQLMISNATPAAAWATMSGDGAISNTGVLSITSVTHITSGTLGVANGGTGAATLGTSKQPLLGNGTAAFTAMAAPTTNDTSADAIAGASAAAKKALVIQGNAAQTANIFEIQNSSGIAQFAISLGSATASGPNDTNLGLNAGASITSGSNNTNVGVNAGSAISSSSFNTLIGSLAGTNLATGSGLNTVVGKNGAATLTSGTANTVIGSDANVNSAAAANTVVVGQASKAETGGTIIGQGITSTTTNDLILRSADTGIKRDGASGVISITDGSGNVLTRFGRLNYQTKSAAYTVVQADGWSHFDVDATGGGNLPLITLPSAATVGAGWTVWISKADTATTAATASAPNPFTQYNSNPVPIVCNSADGIDGIPWTQKSLAAAGTFSITSNVVTITTSAAHGLIVGSVVTIAAVTNTYLNGTFVVTGIPSTTTFTYALTHANVGSTADTGTVTYATTWLTQQHGKICLMSTGVAGSGAKQGWTVIECSGECIDTGPAVVINGPSNATQMLITLSLPPGEWDVSGLVVLNLNNATVSSAVQWLGGTSTNLSTLNLRSINSIQPTVNYSCGLAIPPAKVVASVASYVSAAMSTQVVTGGTPQGAASVVARRSR